jgi:hypothetical protein
LTDTDYAALVAYRQTAVAAMPGGSQFTFEIFFNGASGNGSAQVRREEKGRKEDNTDVLSLLAQ